MNQNENVGAEITLTEENESSTAMYELSPEDFAALTADATELFFDDNGVIDVFDCINCPDIKERWYKLTVNETENHSIYITGTPKLIGYLYDSSGNLLLRNNADNDYNHFFLNFDLVADRKCCLLCFTSNGKVSPRKEKRLSWGIV